MNFEFDPDLGSKVLGIWFRLNNFGYGENSQQDMDFLSENKFKVIITRESWHNGYDSDSDKLHKNGMTINTPYTLKSMNVDRSSSTLELEERPDINFNSVNFKFLKQ